MLKKLSLFFALLAVPSVLADFTPHDKSEASGKCRGGYLFAAGLGKTPKEAREKAVIEIGNKVSANVETVTDIAHSQHEIDGIPYDTNSYSERSKIISKLSNAAAVKEIGSPEPQSGDSYESKVYMCNTDAAEPYLNSLTEQAGKFKNAVLVLGSKETWEKVVSMYKTLKDLEIILKNLGQINHALQNEYESDYSEAKKKYEALVKRKAVHISVSGSEYVAEELGAALQTAGCDCTIAEKISESDYAVSVKAKLNRCGKPEHGITYCFANATVSVKNSRTNKTTPVQIPEASAGWPSHEPKRAVEEAYRELTESIAQELLKEVLGQ